MIKKILQEKGDHHVTPSNSPLLYIHLTFLFAVLISSVMKIYYEKHFFELYSFTYTVTVLFYFIEINVLLLGCILDEVFVWLISQIMHRSIIYHLFLSSNWPKINRKYDALK